MSTGVLGRAVLLAALGLMSACAEGAGQRAAAPAEAAVASPLSSSDPPAEGSRPLPVTRCDAIRLPPGGVAEADFGLDVAQGLLAISFSGTGDGEYRNVTHTVRYLEDPACRSTPGVAELIGRVRPPGWFPAARLCPVRAPSELPDGTAPEVVSGGAGETHHSWGKGDNRVTIGRGHEVVDSSGDPIRFPRTGGEPVRGSDGVRRWVVAVGDPPLGQISYQYVVDGCPYVLWTESGMSWQGAIDLAARLATPVAAR